MTREPSNVKYDRPTNNCIPPSVVVMDVFTPEECDRIIEIGNWETLETAKVRGGSVQSQIRSSSLRFIEPDGVKVKWIFERLKEITDNVNDRIYEFQLNYFSPPQFTHYGVGDYYDWHMDLLMGKPCEAMFMRKLSATVFLSNPKHYTGGELLMGRNTDGGHEEIIEAKQGSMVLFPSFIWHKINPVKSGERYSLVVWNEGHKFV